MVARATGVSRRAITEGMKELKQPKGRGRVPLHSPASGGKVRDEREPWRRMPRCWRTWIGWWIRRPAEIRNRRCAGHARVCADWPKNSSRRATPSVTRLWPNCCMSWTTACRPTRRRWKGSQHADRDEQFEHINRKAQRYLKQGQPVISVDTKKKELVGGFQERRAGVAAQGATRSGSRSRLRNPRARQGQSRSLWRL